MLAKWVERGFQAYHDVTAVRGQVLNFLDTTFTHNTAGNPGGGMAAGLAPAADPRHGSGRRTGLRPGARRTRAPCPASRRYPADGPRRAAGAAPRGGGGMPFGPGGMPPGGPGFGPGGPGMGGGMGGMPGLTGPTNRFKVNYYSNYIAIDFRGGEKVSRRSSLSRPAKSCCGSRTERWCCTTSWRTSR